MKRILIVLLVGISLVPLSAAGASSDWDPSGAWGIEGRTDATLTMSCKGDTCNYALQSAYGRYKASGFIKGDQLVVAYTYLTEDSFGFILFERRGDNRMSSTTYNSSGKVLGTYPFIRK